MRITWSDTNRGTWKHYGYVSFASYSVNLDAEKFMSSCKAKGIDIKKMFLSGGRIIRIYKSACYPKGVEDYNDSI